MDHPLTKELIRAWLKQRQAHPKPLPELAQIRRQLGWETDPPGPAGPIPAAASQQAVGACSGAVRQCPPTHTMHLFIWDES
jgi:hypothetical protein